MQVKILEVRDIATMFAVLCVDMNPGEPTHTFDNSDQARIYHLRRVGYPCDGRPNIMITHLSGGKKADNDPYSWGDRTFATAHGYIIEHWAELSDGDVIDVEFILGESKTKKISERFGG